MSYFCIIFYLLTIVVANGAVTSYGQVAMPFVAFVLIPFDLVSRDVLHERWRDSFLWPKMFCLVTGGSIISFISSVSSIQVSYASSLAFLVTGVVDVSVYHLLERFPRLVKMNSSNLAAALVDSVIFPLAAFGVVVPALSIAQTFSKFSGGILWSLVFVFILRKINGNKDHKGSTIRCRTQNTRA